MNQLTTPRRAKRQLSCLQPPERLHVEQAALTNVADREADFVHVRREQHAAALFALARALLGG